jgi:hypothetical protein
MDLATLMRLRSAIHKSLESSSVGQAAVAGGAMSQTYMSCRAEVHAAIDPSLVAEFERMFPEMSVSHGIGLTGAAWFNDAMIALGRMDGWLEGQIEYLKYEREVQANAAARRKAERGIGFKTPRGTD